MLRSSWTVMGDGLNDADSLVSQAIVLERPPHVGHHHLRATRFWLGVVMAGLLLSGITAFPLKTELRFFLVFYKAIPYALLPRCSIYSPGFHGVYKALASTNQRYPFLAYGTDWLAFAHLVIAVAFIGAVSTGRCNTGMEFTRWCFKVQRLAGPLIEAQGYLVEICLGVAG